MRSSQITSSSASEASPSYTFNNVSERHQPQQQQSPISSSNSKTSRRKSSLALEKAEGGGVNVYVPDRDDGEKMLVINSASVRKKLWLRAITLIFVFAGLIWFFTPEDNRRIPKFSEYQGIGLTINIFQDDSPRDLKELSEEDGDLLANTRNPAVASNSASDSPLTSSYCTVPHPGRQLIQYALMIDAGSTGSRIHIYRFNYCKASPTLENEVFAHTEPGLSAYNDPIQAAKSLDTLLQVALQNVPTQLYNCTPVAVKATAGLRLLGKEKSETILKTVRERLENNYPFPIIEKNGVVIMDGKDEGVYAWITVNYLLDRIGSVKKQPTAAIFDLGGGSTQIVFEPDTIDGFEVAPGDHKYELEFGGHTYILYQHSYLGYGLMEARKAMKNFMAKLWQNIDTHDIPGLYFDDLTLDNITGDNYIPHPCFPKNFTDLWINSTFIGTGAGHAQCRAITEKVLNKEKECPLAPCAFDGIYQPPIRETFSFHDIYAFSYFYDRASPLGMPSEFSLRELGELAEEVCSGNLEKFAHLPQAIKELKKNPHYCMDLTFIYGLLHIGYEIPLEREVKIAKKIKGIETGWCLGATIAVLDAKLWCRI
ncbi:5883_t:CDS:2 [Ambispora leptoticha]|uniref:guanosine-diphosphatase n=1 Tax=Ambispora leptoticha TaxID=144679 RepID=A0A9N9AYR0_9GLOM|nr:5883_t:CDS:2 [Ambispora leptoticha]